MIVKSMNNPKKDPSAISDIHNPKQVVPTKKPTMMSSTQVASSLLQQIKIHVKKALISQFKKASFLLREVNLPWEG
jgi:hypothetical protein